MRVLFGYEEEHAKSCYWFGFDQFKLFYFFLSGLVYNIIVEDFKLVVILN